MARKVVDTLIIDLDNTIFDWFAVWYASFKPIYDGVVARSGKSPEEVEAAIRAVHQKRRTSEYTFLLEELEILQELGSKEGGVRALFHEEVEASRHARDHSLRLYPSVFRSLWDIKNAGTKIVAYTESMCFYSAYRLKRFGLDGVIDVLFSPEDHDTPAGVSLDRMRRLPDEFYELQVTQIRHTPPGELKPNPRVLLDIISSIGAQKERCVYVGDSLFKDVAMARDVGVFDVHAQYGESQRKPEYGLLQRVSHWTEADVKREAEITAKGHDFTPSAVLKDTFAEIFIYCEFGKFPDGKREVGLEHEHKNVIEVWKTCVSVQQHFNDLEMRIRNFAISVAGALIASVSFTYQQGLETKAWGYTVPTGLGLVVAAVFAWGGFFLMDRYWYHILLKGSVMHAGKIEDRYKDEIPEIGLGRTISAESGKVKILWITMNSDRRLTAFYIAGFIILGLLFFALLFAKPAHKVASSENDATVSSTQSVPIAAPEAKPTGRQVH
jgi:FMN phosphatase YigB (HAD superfamily)